MSITVIDPGQSGGQPDALRGRARGVMIGSLIAFGWAFYAASILPPALRYGLVAVAAGVAASLVFGSVAMMRIARSLPPATPDQARAKRRVWMWFWFNLVGEIVLLNIAVALLSPPHLRVFWIPAISAVVGLHFLPMAVFFRTRSYWFVGAAMLAGAVAATVFIMRLPETASAIVHGEGMANALILWSALAMAVAYALRPRA